LGFRPSSRHHDWHIDYSKFAGSQHAAVACDDRSRFIDEDWIGPTPLLDGRRNLIDLRCRMGSSVLGIAYRIQELAYGGLKKETVERLRVLGKQYDGEAGERPKGRGQRLPISGTRLIREWQGVEHVVTVRGDDFEYQGRLYKSLSAIAREITGVRWNGWVFFGLKNHRGAA
jgi:Protein of unknown function (DUF2924)